MGNSTGLLLSLACVAVGAWVWGWRGVVLALSVVAFWAVLQFNRSLRLMRQAGRNPVGRISSAAAFQATLARGESLLQIIGRTQSLGQRVSQEPEVWRWADAGGDAVQVRFERGRVADWTLLRGG